MSRFETAAVPARAPARSSASYARQRLGVGLAFGFLAQALASCLLGFGLLGGIDPGQRAVASLISSLVVAPALCALGFACLLRTDGRSFGLGVVAGALSSAFVLLAAWLVL